MKIKKITALLLALLMILALPLGANAASAPIFKTGTVSSGDLSDTVSYTINEETGVLTISGTGAIPDYNSSQITPWKFNDKVTSLVIEEGITRIGNYAFERRASLKSCSLPSTLESVGEYAFESDTGLEEIVLPSKVTKVEKYAFYSCKGVKNFTTTSVITELGFGAFGCMFGVENLDAYSVETLDSLRNTFRYVVNLTLRNGTITEDTFNCAYELENLKTLTFGNGVRAVEEHDYFHFPAIEAINIVDDNPFYTSVDGVLYTYDMGTILAYPICKRGHHIRNRQPYHNDRQHRIFNGKKT